MGACTNLSKGRGIDCTRSAGGVKNVYLANFEHISITVAASEVTAFITGVVFDGRRFPLFKYALPKRGGSVAEVLNADANTLTALYYTQGLTIYLDKLSKEDQDELHRLGQSKLIAFVELNQRNAAGHNVILCLGIVNGLRLNSGNNASGDNWSSANGYEWILTGMEKEPMAVCADYTNTPLDNVAYVYGGIITS